MTRIVPESAILIPETAQRVFQGEIFDVYQWPQRLFDGSQATFEMLRRPDTVLFIAVKEDKIILVREAQPHRAKQLRIPGGRVDAGEDWLQAVKRECSEEVGMSFAEWKLVAVEQPVAKIEWFVAIFIAWDVSDTHVPHIDVGEKIAIKAVGFSEFKAFVQVEAELSSLQSLLEEIHDLESLLKLPAFEGKRIN